MPETVNLPEGLITIARRRVMHRVLVVCGAGASSTFLAHRIRALARRSDIAATVTAASTVGLEQRRADIDVLLVGPHLNAQFDELRAMAAGSGVASALLPESVFGAGGEEAALQLVLQLSTPRSR
jgi:PTS system cellobiose-specific IIB component